MFCIHCGKELATENVRFCPFCGELLNSMNEDAMVIQDPHSNDERELSQEQNGERDPEPNQKSGESVTGSIFRENVDEIWHYVLIVYFAGEIIFFAYSFLDSVSHYRYRYEGFYGFVVFVALCLQAYYAYTAYELFKQQSDAPKLVQTAFLLQICVDVLLLVSMRLGYLIPMILRIWARKFYRNYYVSD